ncbi:MAG: biotin transporter BioY, partial [Deltaproteobacteria bacterium]|nr:biotin transporter BioY [Deltaproteobacteria bacterium]
MTGFISERFRHSLIGGIIGVIIGSLAVYCFGVPWLKTITKMSWNKAWMVGMLPFLLGDALKAAVAIVLARAVRPMLNRQTQTASTLTPTLSHRREREREQ